MLALILLLPVAQADIKVNKFTNEFSLSSSKIDGKACAGSTHTLPVEINNVGDVEGVFEIKVESEKDWFSLSETSFHLGVDEKTTQKVTTKLPFTYTGRLDYTIKVSSTYGRTKRLHRTLNVVKCNSIELKDKATTDIVNPAQTAKFRFTVKNPASFTDEYEIKPLKHEDKVRISENQFPLGQDEQKQVFVYTRFAPHIWGDYTIPVQVKSKQNGQTKKVNLDLTIKREYDYKIQVSGQVKTCTQTQKTVPVTITNNANVSNTYKLNFEGPQYTSLNRKEVTLNPGQTKTLEITLNPSDAQTGKEQIKLSATSQRGQIELERVISVNAENCYEHQVSMPETHTMICGNDTINVNVRNDGTQPEKFQLRTKAPLWMNLEQKIVRLDPNENKNIPMTINAPCSNQNYDIMVEAVNRDQNHITEKANMKLNVHTQQSAYKVTLDKNNYDIRKRDKQFQIKVNNEGIRGGTYQLSLDSDFLTLEQQTLTLKNGESKNITINIGNITNLEGEYLHPLTISIKDNQYQTTIGTNIQGPNIIEKAFTWTYQTLVKSEWYKKIGWCGWSTILLFLGLAALIAVAILINQGVIETTRFTTQYRTHFQIINTAFLIIAIMGIVFFTATYSTTADRLYEPSQMNGSPLYHEWKQGNNYQLNLSRYFEDPDEDKLTYDYKNASIKVVMKDSIAEIQPQNGWSGTTTIIFTATDEEGLTATSPEMTLHVREKTQTSWWDYWLANCTSINALLIALIFLTLFYLADKVEPRGKEYYFGE